jgi:tyrosine-specific transport protein
MNTRRKMLLLRTVSFLIAIQLLCLELDLVWSFQTPSSTAKLLFSYTAGKTKQHPSSTTGLHVLRPPIGDERTRIPIGSQAETIKNTFSVSPKGEERTQNSNPAPFFFELDGLKEKIGRVQDERIIFPEYDAGEVPRMFSSLQYRKSDETGQVLAQHATGSVLGAASLVAGTMVGAGILALPSATAPVGFVPSTFAMGIGWFYMTMSGLLIAELCINRLGQSGKPGKGMLDLFEDSLGPRWAQVGNLCYFFLHYCLLVAYIAQGGANFSSMLGLGGLGLPSGAPQVLFASICAAGLYSATPSMVEKTNNVLVLVLAAAFVGIITLGASTADFGTLIDPVNQHVEKVADAFPIIFLSLVYHNIVPTVVNQLEGDRAKITKAIIGGTTVPTLMFLAWNAVVLGNVDPSTTGSIDPVALLQSSASTGDGNAILGSLVSTFSSAALVTSLIGFVYGLLDAWTDVFSLPSKGPSYEKWKAPLFGLVFLPPLALSMTDPEIFYKALDYGGAFGVSTLFLVLPPIMVWRQRYGDDQQLLMTKPMGK